jgi:hypothetical protein
MIDPLVLGGGKRLFRDDGLLRPLRLVDSDVTTTGAILATYAPAEAWSRRRAGPLRPEQTCSSTPPTLTVST